MFINIIPSLVYSCRLNFVLNLCFLLDILSIIVFAVWTDFFEDSYLSLCGSLRAFGDSILLLKEVQSKNSVSVGL